MPTIRRATPADSPAIAAVHIDTWKATYTGRIPDPVLEHFTDRARREQFWSEQLAREAAAESLSHTFVAEDSNGAVAGFAICGPARRDATDPLECAAFAGEIFAIYVQPGAQGNGLGGALLRAAAADLAEQGLNGLLIWCLESNVQARGFYERMGGRPIGRRSTEMAEALLDEVGYGWG